LAKELEFVVLLKELEFVELVVLLKAELELELAL
jgi:hypothetical protein